MYSRRTMLKALGLTAATTGVGAVGAAPGEAGVGDGLGLEAEVGIPGAKEVVVQDGHAYVAYATEFVGQPRIKTGMVVVDLDAEPQPEVVARTDVARDYVQWYNAANPGTLSLADVTFEILDVKVDGHLAVLASNFEAPGGISIYDVSDPSDPQFRAQYVPTTGEPWESNRGADVHNVFLDGDHAYLTLSEPFNVDGDGDGVRDAVRLFGRTGVDIADLSTPSAPSRAGRWLLRDHGLEDFANGAVSPTHDIYVQHDTAYLAAWDAGVVALDVSDPTEPSFIAQFGADPDGAIEVVPWEVDTSFTEWNAEHFPVERYLTLPGNAHYVQPDPAGDRVYVGAETFPAAVLEPGTFGIDDYGPVDVWDRSDLSGPDQTIPVPTWDDGDVAGKEFTAHNFDVTEDRLSVAWYNGGVRLYDVPGGLAEIASYDPDGYSFWTAVQSGDRVVASVYGATSERSAGGLVVLSETAGEAAAPSFDGGDTPGPRAVDRRTMR